MSDLPLDTLAGMINAKLKKAREAVERGENFETSAGVDLLTAEARVRAGEADHRDFKIWCREHIDFAPDKIQYCIGLADPSRRQELIKVVAPEVVWPNMGNFVRPDEIPSPKKSHKSTGTGRTGRPKEPDSIRTTAEKLGMSRSTLHDDVAAIRAEAEPKPADPTLAKLVALWRQASPDTQAAFRAHIG